MTEQILQRQKERVTELVKSNLLLFPNRTWCGISKSTDDKETPRVYIGYHSNRILVSTDVIRKLQDAGFCISEISAGVTYDDGHDGCGCYEHPGVGIREMKTRCKTILYLQERA